jgi:hypothetical protein
MALFNKGTNILAIEVDKGICIFDLDFKYIRSVNPNDCLKRPSGICVNVNSVIDKERVRLAGLRSSRRSGGS